MIFCNTRVAVDQVKSFLNKQGYAAQALHGEIPQARRMKTIEQFKRGDYHILVATDVAARGIHVEDLSLVVNYDVPNEKDNYIHRVGRTGRAGKTGRAITLVTGDDIMTLYEIEEHIGTLIEEKELPDKAAFKESSANAEAWIKENAIKVVPFTRHGEGKSGKGRNGQKRTGTKKSSDYSRGTGAADSENKQSRNAKGAADRPGKQNTGRKQDSNTADRPGKQSQRNRSGENHNRPVTASGSKQTGSRYNGGNIASGGSGNPRYNKDSRQQEKTPGHNEKYSRKPGDRNVHNNSIVDRPAKANINTADQTKQGQVRNEKKSLLKRIVQKLFGK